MAVELSASAPNATEVEAPMVHRSRREKRLQYLVEHLEQSIWDIDVHTQELFASKAWCDMRGLQRKIKFNLSHDRWHQVIHPDDQDKIIKLIAGDFPDGSNEWAVEFRYRLSNGEWVWILTRAKIAETDETGKPKRLIGADTLIDHIKKDAEVRAELTEKLQLAIDASGIGIWEYNGTAQTVHWDDRMLEIYGLSGTPNTLPNTVWNDHLHPLDAESAIAHAESCQKDRSDFKHDFRIVRPDGSVRYIRGLARYVSGDVDSAKWIGVNIDVTADYERMHDLEDAHRRLEHESRHDALTGLANRRLLDETMQSIANGAHPGSDYAVLHLDLDHFKVINDSLGHAAGDAVLRRTADILRAKVGQDGLVSRTGGDEFVVLYNHAVPKPALSRLCETLVSEISAPFMFEGRTCSAGVSIGVAYGVIAANDHADTFRRADKALYSAKFAGRGGVQFYTKGQTESPLEAGVSRQDILDALSRGEFTCHYQPQFDAQTLAVVGAEALVRWDCPNRGLLPPDHFLPKAEESDLINHIDKHVLSLVLQHQTQWHQAGIAYPNISLNVTKERIFRPGLSDWIGAQLSAHHLLSFELLETAFIDAPDADLAHNLAQLRAMHIQIELDDFGSGHSSVMALQTIKPDRIKIDRGLVAPIVSEPGQLLMLNSLSYIARLQGAQVVIEGLETGLHLAAIRNVDCDVLQGYGLHRPVPENEFVNLLASQPLPPVTTPYNTNPITQLRAATVRR